MTKRKNEDQAANADTAATPKPGRRPRKYVRQAIKSETPHGDIMACFGTWVGDDLEACLKMVIDSRGRFYL